MPRIPLSSSPVLVCALCLLLATAGNGQDSSGAPEPKTKPDAGLPRTAQFQYGAEGKRQAEAKMKAIAKRLAPGSSAGPLIELNYQILVLIESDDQNRRAYDGPAAKGLAKAGFSRTVIAGSAAAVVTVGKPSSVSGHSRYGQMSTSVSLLNTTEANRVQVDIQVRGNHAQNLVIDTTARLPLGRWVLIGATDTRSGVPTHAPDGTRAVVIMKLQDGPVLLD
ncbi:hypothetical protein [Roseimaritima sediminicola]|uniref:hypothetical protein n=1 Tax=Roseimaritima sediminicola TaxID=2662066 RepID=UPI00129838C4|nr:hypothetical protein [Roseimaritima sediminicola]